MSTAPADRCRVPQAFWHVVERIGVPPAALLRQARLPATLHLGGPGQVNTAQFFALWQALEQLAPGPGLGISLVQAADTAVHPPSSLAAFHARDYRDGLARMARARGWDYGTLILKVVDEAMQRFEQARAAEALTQNVPA